MARVAGVDFGTLSVRVSVFDSDKGRIGSATADYPLMRRKEDPDHATQRHACHMTALEEAMKKAVREAGIEGASLDAIALDTTGSTVAPVGEGLEPLDDYYLWCDHRASEEAARITETAHREGLEAIKWCGGVYSSEWGWAKLLHWLRHNPDKRERMVTAIEHCDMVAAVLCGIRDAEAVPRSVCAMGHKWMWNEALGGCRRRIFSSRWIPCWRECAQRWADGMRPRTRSPAGCRRSGPGVWGCALGFQSRWAHLMRIGTRWARACGKAMWSTWWALPRA